MDYREQKSFHNESDIKSNVQKGAAFYSSNEHIIKASELCNHVKNSYGKTESFEYKWKGRVWLVYDDALLRSFELKDVQARRVYLTYFTQQINKA